MTTMSNVVINGDDMTFVVEPCHDIELTGLCTAVDTRAKTAHFANHVFGTGAAGKLSRQTPPGRPPTPML